MSKLDPYELEVLEAYEAGKLKPGAGKAELQRLRAAARISDPDKALAIGFILKLANFQPIPDQKLSRPDFRFRRRPPATRGDQRLKLRHILRFNKHL